MGASIQDLVFISLEPWDEIWRRNQFICAELASRHREIRILFVIPPLDVSHALRKGVFILKGANTGSGFTNIHVVQALKLFPNSWRLGRKVNAWLMRRALRNRIRHLRLIDPILWVNDHGASHLPGKLGEKAVVYDITDDWITPDQASRERALIRDQDSVLCGRADAVIVCSERLRQLKQSLVAPEKLHLVPNGVDAEHYRRVDDVLPDSAECANWIRPVFGYTGTIHRERVDIDLTIAIAEKMSEGCMVFIGPNHLSGTDKKKMLATGRIVLHDPVPYTKIPEYMRAFDACIVPHRMTDFTESLNPIKLWEYLAVGKPIVTTDIAGFRDYPEEVRITRTADEFFLAMQEALLEVGDLKSRRREIAARHSWKARVDQVEDILHRLTPQVRGAS